MRTVRPDSMSWSLECNTPFRGEKKRGDALESLGNEAGIDFFWITILGLTGVTKNLHTKLPFFSHVGETTRLNSIVIKLSWQYDIM